MSTVTTRRERGGAEPRPRTIGSVCEELREQFPDVSVSKIRYLEDQGLISPRRTRGGYRLFAPDDIERRPRSCASSGTNSSRSASSAKSSTAPARRVIGHVVEASGVLGHEDEIDEAELCNRASVSPELVRQLEEFGIVISRSESGERIYGESEADIAAACARLARFGVDARHLRTFLTGAGRQAALVEQLVAPGLRSRNPERRKNALEDIEALSRVAQELSHLLLLRDLRATVERTS